MTIADEEQIMRVSSESPPDTHVNASIQETIIDHSGLYPGLLPYKHGHYTAMDQARAKVFGLRILTESELRQQHSEGTVEQQVAGQTCTCFRMAAGEHLVLTRQMYETLWSSNLLPVGARSTDRVFTNRHVEVDWLVPPPGFILLMKGRGMPYPVAWVDDVHRQLGVHCYLAAMASVADEVNVPDPEDQVADLLCSSD
ncbi:MAG: hypothetical protein GY934_08630, partial [Gammaproteobacteria bacterium]|nr:hypothetical protein [Gammaproteobacteria bacterium]